MSWATYAISYEQELTPDKMAGYLLKAFTFLNKHKTSRIVVAENNYTISLVLKTQAPEYIEISSENETVLTAVRDMDTTLEELIPLNKYDPSCHIRLSESEARRYDHEYKKLSHLAELPVKEAITRIIEELEKEGVFNE